jgi:hypothetical protein
MCLKGRLFSKRANTCRGGERGVKFGACALNKLCSKKTMMSPRKLAQRVATVLGWRALCTASRGGEPERRVFNVDQKTLQKLQGQLVKRPPKPHGKDEQAPLRIGPKVAQVGSGRARTQNKVVRTSRPKLESLGLGLGRHKGETKKHNS